jgi:hypothetical protein
MYSAHASLACGGWDRNHMRNDNAKTHSRQLFDLGQLAPKELLGMASGVLLFATLSMPWYATSPTDPYSQLAGASHGASATAWQTFSTLDWFLATVCLIPFALGWTLVSRTQISWPQGEITMLLGVIAAFLIICNGIILGKPAGAIGISLNYGYFVAIAASIGIAIAGFQRQLITARDRNIRKPPGIL